MQKITEADLSDSLHNVGTIYASQLSKVTAAGWSYLGKRRTSERDSWPNQPVLHFLLTCARRSAAVPIEGLTIRVSADQHTARVTCTPVPPRLPDGTPHGITVSINDFLQTSYERGKTIYQDKPEASFALARFRERPELIAVQIWNKVIKPYLAIYPKIQERIDQRASNFNARDKAVAELVQKFGGRVADQASTGGSVYISIPDGPPLRVSEGGFITFAHTPNFSIEAMRVVLPLLIERRAIKAS